jgi:toxin CptA
MHWPPPVRVALSPSRTALALIATLALATCAVIQSLPFDPAVLGFATIASIVWAGDRIHVVALRRGPRAVRQLDVRADLTVIVVTGDGTAVAGRVHHDTYVGAHLSTIVWRPYGRWKLRALLLLPDMLPAQEFRRLRVLLRYGRSDVAHGDPASHA